MKVIFFGTPDFSVGTLEALVEAVSYTHLVLFRLAESVGARLRKAGQRAGMLSVETVSYTHLSNCVAVICILFRPFYFSQLFFALLITLLPVSKLIVILCLKILQGPIIKIMEFFGQSFFDRILDFFLSKSQCSAGDCCAKQEDIQHF